MQEADMQERLWIVLIGVIQGALLALGHHLEASHLWPLDSFSRLIIWVTLVIGVGLSLQLLIHYVALVRCWLVLGGIALVLGALAWYTGQTILSPKHASLILRPFALTTGLSLLLVLSVVRAWFANGRSSIRYRDVFEHGLELVFLVVLAGWFIATYSVGLLVIGVFVEAWLFTVGALSSLYIPVLKATLVYPFAGLFSGLAIAMGQSSPGVTTAVRRTLLASCTWAIPALALVQISAGVVALLFPRFIFALIAALAGQVLTVVAINGLVQDGETPAPRSRLIRWSIAALIVVGLLTCVLHVRSMMSTVTMLGLTTQVVTVGLIEGVIAVSLVGYLIALVERNPQWMRLVGPTNMTVAAIIIGLTGLVNTPVLDPKRIVVEYQLRRILESDRLPVSALLWYSHSGLDLGRAGFDAVNDLTRVTQHPQAEDIRNIAKSSLQQLECGMKPIRGLNESTPVPARHGRVYLAALDKASIPRVLDLVPYYQQHLNLSVEALVDDPFLEDEELAADAKDDCCDRLVSEAVMSLMAGRNARIMENPDAVLIGLTDQSVRRGDYSSEAFSVRDHDRFAIVSSDWMYAGMYRAQPDEELLGMRIKKITKKNIGMLYYGLPESGYRDSVLCGPITDVEDLDLIGENF
jgi:hypothetical protein